MDTEMSNSVEPATASAARGLPWWSVAGICIGVLSILLGAYRQANEPVPDRSQPVSERLADGTKNYLSHVVRGKPSEKAQRVQQDLDQKRTEWRPIAETLHISGIALGVLALICGLTAAIRRENRRLAFLAIGAGACGALFDFLGVAIGIAFLFVAFSSIMS
jgi:Flp pilus assembly protein TadB